MGPIGHRAHATGRPAGGLRRPDCGGRTISENAFKLNKFAGKGSDFLQLPSQRKSNMIDSFLGLAGCRLGGGALSEKVCSPEGWPKNLQKWVWRPGCYV